MTIYLATDHAGFVLKEKIKTHLHNGGYAVVDCGAFEENPTDDYPAFISKAAEMVSKNPTEDRAIIFGGSGQGENMVADKFPHVRSAVYYGGSLDIIRLSREHNDANVLSLGARFVSEEQAFEAVDLWLTTPFSKDERHVRRIAEIEDIEEKV
jgi:ribose 5-phosphate isomerase B